MTAGTGQAGTEHTGGTPAPLLPAVQADALRTAFPAYAVTVVTHGGRVRFEAVTKDDSNPWCLISADPSEIRRELEATAALRTPGGPVPGHR